MDNNSLFEPIKGFIDGDGRLTSFPAKHKKKLYALFFLAARFEAGREYTEKEVNEVLNSCTAFRDPATLRRELFDHFFLGRDKAGSRYWLEEKQPDPRELGLLPEHSPQ